MPREVLQLELRGPRCSEGTLLNPCVAYPTIVWGGLSLVAGTTVIPVMVLVHRARLDEPIFWQ